MPKLDSSQFGPNLWLMQEMHERYLRQPDSVSEAWREFFEDYFPNEHQARPPAPQIPEDIEQAPPPPPPASAAPRAPSSTNGQAGDPLSRADAVLASRMEDSLSVPTATSVRVIPAKLLEVNRNILNNHQARSRSKKVSFTHLLGWAVVKAMAKFPGMNTSYGERDGKPVAIHHPELNLGLAVDIAHDDGSRSLWVPNIKGAGNLSFVQFFAGYEDLIRKVRSRRITPADMEGTTVTLTNPGMLGTAQSVPRLMQGQAAIIGVGSIAFPAEYQGSDPTTLADLGIGKVVTLTSTYDHRVIQGALSGEFLAEVQRLLMGEDEFYEEIFANVGVPYVPVQWRIDRNPARNSRESDAKQARVLQLINIYRVRGHLLADLDPLDATPPKMPSELDPATYGFTIWDLDRKFPTGTLANTSNLNDRRRRATDVSKPETLGNILTVLRDAYCRTVGIEYMHISDPAEKRWIQERVEGVDTSLEPQDHDRILAKLNEAEAFEAFLHTKYIGHKRFSLEGALSMIPMVDAVLDAATRASMEEAVIGMAHRGRLNLLANIIGKSYTQIFKEFEGNIDPDTVHGSGDVKYHIGASGRYTNPQGVSMPVSVVSNPSHLESVDPVVEGVVRAKQDALNRPEEFGVLPVLIHGDAAFAGQGVVAETLNLSQLRGYRTGGTVHVIVNNQVGFTATAGETRSSYYASDVAKMIQAPIFHVNGDDPEACVRVARLAFEYRQAFHKDVVIDMWCYRKWGHNEADEPSYTQPLMYKRIASRRSVRKLYTESLLYRNRLTLEEAEGALEDFRSKLQGAFNAMNEQGGNMEPPADPPQKEGPAAVGLATLNQVLEITSRIPPNFAIHPKLAKLLEARGRALATDSVDWSVAEILAFGSLLANGISIRMAGQDSRRGTFSQRHAVFIDQETGAEYTPLLRVGKGAKFLIYDSMLSEFAALGFEYGYSTVAENTLTIWEAQFGDFANGAQVAIDQFIAAGEDKWEQTSNLVMLLPHGFEGQGPEHSSARLERFLALGAEDNYRVTMPSTAAQYFHLLWEQGSSALRKPLVVLTPKSLLRLPAAASGVIDLINAGWKPVLGDPTRPNADAVRRLILCSGKVYYDLAAARDKLGLQGLALVRIEQLYPFPVDEIAEELHRYENAEVLWVQEEPENMGAWRYMHTKFSDHFKVPLLRRTRTESASPASGSAKTHEREQEQLISGALAGLAD